MKAKWLLSICLGFCLVQVAPAQEGSAGKDPLIAGCLVRLVDDIKLPATEQGVLTYLGVKEGSDIEDGKVIAKIDDREPQMQKKVAQYGYKSAFEKYNDDVEKRYSEAASDVAKANYDEFLAANSGKIKMVVTEYDLRTAELEWKRATLAIEKALHDKQLALLEAYVKQAEVEAAKLAIELRTVHAPFNGKVVKLFRKEDEWVNPGDPIMQVIRLDTLYVEGNVYLDEYDPRDIQNCDVTVVLNAGRGESMSVPGKVVYVSPMITYGAKLSYLVRAEITNRNDAGQWVVFPGMQADMTVHLGTATPAVSRNPQ